MLPSFTRLHLTVHAPAHDAFPTGMQEETDEETQARRLKRLRSVRSLIPQDPLQRGLGPSQRSQQEPQKPATMQPLIDRFVTRQFLLQWKREDLETRNWTLHQQHEIPAVYNFGFEDASMNCDIVCLNPQTHAAALVVCTLHTPRNFTDALGEVLRHSYYYGVWDSSSTEDIVAIIALDHEPRVHEQNLAAAHGVQCWWPKRSIAECLGEASPDTRADKENASPDP